MHYFAKLTHGGNYIFRNVKYERNVEQPVTKEVYDYFKTLIDVAYIDEGNGNYRKTETPRFTFRTEDFTKEERILNETKDDDVELGPKKPGRKPKED